MEILVSKENIRNKLLKDIPFPKEFVEALIMTDEIDLQFIQDTLGWMSQDARNLLSYLNRHHALKRFGRVYRKTVVFTSLLKELEFTCGDFRPTYVEEEF